MKTWDDNKGTVLIMVLMFMLVAMFIGIALTKAAITETKIVANEKVNNQDFYLSESAAEIVFPQFDNIVSAVSWTVNHTEDISDRMPAGSPLDGAEVKMTLKDIGIPPDGSGSSAAKTSAYFYSIEATMNNKTVEIGVWKAFPKPGS